MENCDFRPSITLAPMKLKFDTTDYVCHVTPHVKIGGHQKWAWRGVSITLHVNTIRPSRLQLSTVRVGVHGTVSCRTALTRCLWTFYVCTLTDWRANVSALETILGPRVLCVDALYKLTFTYLLAGVWQNRCAVRQHPLWNDRRQVP